MQRYAIVVHNLEGAYVLGSQTLDSARLKAAIEMFPMFFPTGGWLALAGASSSIALGCLPYLSTSYSLSLHS